MRPYQIEIAELAVQLGRCEAHLTATMCVRIAYKLKNKAKRHRFTCEQMQKPIPQTAKHANYASRKKLAEDKIKHDLLPEGWTARFTDDPSKPTVYLLMPNGDYNTMAGKDTGWAI